MAVITPKWPPTHPVIACSTAELARLRTAFESRGPSQRPVISVVAAAEKLLEQTVSYPPRGGQHNQWYQCDKCQIALKTVDDTHHQCPRCKKVYSGEPYDDVIFSKQHTRNLMDMDMAAWAYAVTNRDEFAEFAKQVLLGYADRYEKYPFHSAGREDGSWDKRSGGHLFEQTLNEASSLTTQIVPAYDLIHDAPVLIPDDHTRIREGLLLPMLHNIDKNKAGKTNWQTWHNAAMLWGGAVIKDASWIKKAIAEPENGFLYQMGVSVTTDGMWYENSWGYHFYTLSAMVEIAEGARRLGIDVWSHRALKKMFTLPVQYAMPDDSLPRFGDDVNMTTSHASHYLEFAYNVYRDDTILPYLRDKFTWESTLFGRIPGDTATIAPLGSQIFKHAGHAILRTSGEAGLATALTFGPYGGFHGHYDKLSFVFFGHGSELGVDPGRAASQAYRLPIHKNWYKATISHNAVLVDKSPQEGVEGSLKLFLRTEAYAATMATCYEAYPGVKNRRLLVLAPTYLLVLDKLDAEENHRFDWVYHGRGTKATCDAATQSAALDKAFPGLEYVKNTQEGITDEPIRIEIENNAITTHLTMAPSRSTKVLVGDGPGASVEDRVPMAMVSRQGKSARYAAVLEPTRDGTPPSVTNVTLAERKGILRIQILQTDAVDTVFLDGSKLIVKHNDEVVLKK